MTEQELIESECSEDELILLDIVGVDLMCEISDQLGGRSIYISKRPYRALRDMKIRLVLTSILETGRNMKMELVYGKLARRYGVSKRQVRRIITECVDNERLLGKSEDITNLQIVFASMMYIIFWR